MSRSRYLFHSTFESNVPNIACEGLTPDANRDVNYDGYAADDRLVVSRNFFAASDYVMSDYDVPLLVQGVKLDSVVLRFLEHEGDVNGDEDGTPADGFFFLAAAVEPEEIEVWHRQRWVMLDQYVQEMQTAPIQAPVHSSMMRMH